MSEWLERLTGPTLASMDAMRILALYKANDAIDLVRELRDKTVLPEEQPEQLQKILTALNQLKSCLLINKGDL